jgi:hypothetical protein
VLGHPPVGQARARQTGCRPRVSPIARSSFLAPDALAWDGWVADRQTILSWLRRGRPFVLAAEGVARAHSFRQKAVVPKGDAVLARFQGDRIVRA